MVTLKEYDKLYLKKENVLFFKSIENFIKDNIEIAQFLKLGRDKIGDFLQAQNYVGIIQTKNGEALEILPKIYNENGYNSINESKSILLKMLRSLRNYPFKNIDISNLSYTKLPLTEIFISMFLNELYYLIKKGIKSDYIEHEDNLGYLRGKLNISKQIQYNHKERFYIHLAEFNTDRVENRLIKSTLAFLQKISRSNQNKQRIQEYLYLFDHISLSKDTSNDFSKVKLDRQMSYYVQILLWCKIFLQGNSFSPYRGNDIAFAFLLDMNKIFESYVGYNLKKMEKNIQLQHCEHHLLKDNITDNYKFKLKPDIYIREKNIIIDSKWKKIVDDSDFNQADFYQLLAYGNKYKCKNMYLIYPTYDICYPKSFNYNTNNSTDLFLNIIFFNIKNDIFCGDLII
ncbi:McrC family protein [Mannheimia sp. AT1]|uniref:McrC family protein n=1 Tax=Mannheimia cairinae TaxID=3025936 RepID=A0ABT5MPZ8_9PAST|nr:McrC family protein [Mannheimia cairinae]MDD0824247.1 McrC family protein [Mannheimia cairinae]MDD0826630.1 McrC family protein [Mannheimia cairinae]